jgi:hypothetical protein
MWAGCENIYFFGNVIVVKWFWLIATTWLYYILVSFIYDKYYISPNVILTSYIDVASQQCKTAVRFNIVHLSIDLDI